jgi:NitT/TauT family transport system substrate-binding protein
MRRRLAVVLSAVLAVLPVAGCGSDEPSSGGGSGQPDDVKVGLISILDVAPIYLGKEKGFFADHDINLTLQPAEAGTETIPAVLNGDYQFGYSNIVTLLAARAQGLPVKITNNGNNSTGVQGADFGSLFVKGDSPIASVQDLAGKRVAVNVLQNIVELSVRASAVKAGIDPSSIEYVKLPFPDMPAALAGGQVDAAFVVEPFQQVVLSQGGRAIASSLVDASPNLSVAQYFTSERLLAENPDLARRFTAAMKESLEYAQSHPDEVRATLPSYTKIPAELIPKLVLPKFPTEVDRDSVEKVASFGLEQKILPSEPDINALLP